MVQVKEKLKFLLRSLILNVDGFLCIQLNRIAGSHSATCYNYLYLFYFIKIDDVVYENF